jgi:hypothetical protein
MGFVVETVRYNVSVAKRKQGCASIELSHSKSYESAVFRLLVVHMIV